jgi:hypothetical protein
MTLPPTLPPILPRSLDTALKRLASALDHLEAAGERRVQADGVRADLEEELSVMRDDRARLAVELDGALARARNLALANTEVRQRLEKAGDTVKSMIVATGGGNG